MDPTKIQIMEREALLIGNIYKIHISMKLSRFKSFETNLQELPHLKGRVGINYYDESHYETKAHIPWQITQGNEESSMVTYFLAALSNNRGLGNQIREESDVPPALVDHIGANFVRILNGDDLNTNQKPFLGLNLHGLFDECLVDRLQKKELLPKSVEIVS